MRKVSAGIKYSVIPAAVIFFFVVSAVTAVFAAGAKHNNIGANNYSRWNAPSRSFLTVTSDGGYMIFDAGSADGEDYSVEYYDSSYNLTGSKTVSLELPVFGTFYSDGNNYYLVTGQNNSDQSATLEVYRVTKYDTNWNRISAASLSNCNTTFPFEAGSADVASSGTKLFVRTCHKMYTSEDGGRHQANVTILINTSDMTILDADYHVSNESTGYSSHSFNQLAGLDGNYFIGVDHGDAYPRAIMITRYKNAIGSGSLSGVNVYQPYAISGTIGDNTTGVSVGGLGISDTHYLVAANSIDQSRFGSVATRNVMITTVNKSTGAAATNWITSYSEGETSATTPYLVKVSDSRFLVLWTQGSALQYAFVNGSGALQGSIYTAGGMLSDCRPVVNGNKAVWYTFDGSQTNFFEINTETGEFISRNPIDINRASFASIGSKEFTGSAIEPEVTVNFGGKTLKKGTDYTVEYQNNVNYGTGKAVITGTGSFFGTHTCTFSITRKNIQDLTIAEIGEVPYTGSAVVPNPTITYGDIVLVKNTDYTLSSTDNISLGEKTLTVTGRGNYTGSTTIPFTIVKKSVNDLTYSTIYDQTYTGSAITPSFTVRNGGKTLTKDTDYTVSYKNNKAIGEAKIIVSGINNYKGTKTITFNILPISLKDLSKSYSTVYTYTGAAIKPNMSFSYNSTELVEGTDYTVECSDNVNAGKAKAVYTGMGIFGDTYEFTYTIKAQSVSYATVTLESTSYTYTGSEIKPKVTVKYNNKTLKAGTDYDVAYSDNVEVGTSAMVTVTGKGNFTGTTTKKFTIRAIDISGFTFSEIPDQTYTGTAIAPTVTVQNGDTVLKKGTDYSVTYYNNTNAGKATVTVTGKGIYSGSKSVDFNILPKDISDFTYSYTKSFDYTRYAITPTVTVTDGTTELRATWDYTVQYSDNINAGKGIITVTGNRNYTGVKTLKFTIKPINLTEDNFYLLSDTYSYTGEEIKPVVYVIWNNRYCREETDYTVSYSNNVNSGTGKVVVEGCGNFTGSGKKTFTINPVSLNYLECADIPDKVYTGLPITPDPEIMGYSKKLVKETDYTVKYTKNTNVGYAGITVTGINNYYGTRELYFRILQADIADMAISLEQDVYYITRVAPEPKVVAKNGQKLLKEGEDYTLSYTNNTKTGTGTVTVTGTGNYKGSACLNFKIKSATPVVSLTTSGDGVNVKWTSIPIAAKYRVYKKNAKGNWAKLTTVAGLNYYDTSVTAGEKCTYTVVALGADGTVLNDYGTGESITYVAPPMSATLKYKATGVAVSWTELAGAAKYRVFRKTGDGDWTKLATTDTLSYVDKTAVYGKTYIYAVRAMTSSGSFISEMGDGDSIIYLAPAPKITLENADKGVSVSWAVMKNAVKYRIYTKDASGTWTKLVTVKEGTTYTDTSVKNGVSYTYAVVGMDSAGRVMNDYGKGKTITREAPVITMDFTLKSVAAGVKASWKAYEGAGKYRVFRKNEAGEWVMLATVKEEGVLFYRDTTAVDGETYTYTVIAMTGGGKALTEQGDGKSITYVKPVSEGEIVEAEVVDEDGNTIVRMITDDEISEDYAEIVNSGSDDEIIEETEETEEIEETAEPEEIESAEETEEIIASEETAEAEETSEVSE